jgi:hypothetical protein
MFSLHFSTASAAFSDDEESTPLARATEISLILCDVANQVQAGALSGPCRDSNGNTEGGWWIEP